MTVPTVLHADEDVLVINKPVGLLSIPDGYDPNKPHVRALLEPEWGRLWIVHRLDKDTSGVMVLARNADAHKRLNRAFEQGEVTKVYHALVRGNPDWQTKEAAWPLRPNVGRRKRTVVDPRRGKPARTHFRVLERFGSHALVEAIPLTGRRHQIRAHLYALGHPIVGDPLYGPGPLPEDPLPHLGLHARRLVFPHPRTQETIAVTAPYPATWDRAFEALLFEKAWVDRDETEG
ncbi:MAG: RluA family pseudouridine synthase [Chloroflexi bacterium]|nr:RluA family pseudouridine synthase [Chloroflexota bacterium]